MASRLDTFLEDNPDYKVVERDTLLKALHQKYNPNQPYDEFVARATGAQTPTPVAGGETVVQERQRPGAAPFRPEGEAGLAMRDVAGEADPVDIIPKYESGWRNIPNYRYDRGHTAGGYWQITDTNWHHYAPRLGIDTGAYPNAMAAPMQVQRQVAKAMYAEQGYAPWAPYNPQLRAALQRGETPVGPGSGFGDVPFGVHTGRAEPFFPEQVSRPAPEPLVDPVQQTYDRVSAQAHEYSEEKRIAKEEERRQFAAQLPLADPMTGMTVGDIPSPEAVDRFARDTARSFLSGTGHMLGALDRPAEWLDPSGERAKARAQMVEELPNLVDAPPPANTLEEKVEDVAGGIAGGIVPGIAQWQGGVPMAVMSGLETAREVAATHGKEASTWESWRDAGAEGLARFVLGRASAMPWGRLTTGLSFASIQGGVDVAEGKSGFETEVGAITNFLMGLLGREITPGAQARINAAEAAAAAGNGEGAMHHLDAVMLDPNVAGAVARAARIRDQRFPDPSGDAADRAAAVAAAQNPPFGPQQRRPIVPATRETNPEARTRAKDTIATVITQRDRRNAQAREHLLTGELLFAGVPDAERINMISDAMHGRFQNIPQAQRPWFQHTATELQENQHLAETLGAEMDYEYYQNYWHLQWRDPDAAQRAIPLLRGGTPSFSRHKVFDDPRQGYALGLELRTTNPAVLAAWRSEAGNQSIARIMAMRDMVIDGLAVPAAEVNAAAQIGHNQPPPAYRMLPRNMQGFEHMNVGGVEYYIHPEAKKMLDWSLDYGRNGAARMLGIDPQGITAAVGEGVYNSLMLLKNATIPVKLAFSAFHPHHVVGIDAAQAYSTILQQSLNGRVSFDDFRRALADRSHLGTYYHGRRISENWVRPYDQLSPIEQVQQSIAIAMGYTPGNPSVYQLNAESALRRTWNDVIPSLQQQLANPNNARRLAAAWRLPVEHARSFALLIGRGIEAIQHPMFGDWIPNLKMGAAMNEAYLLIASRPELLGTGEQAAAMLRHELQMIRRSIDNRYGEMQYDKEFINPLIRKATMASMLSVGWNYGFFREFGGGTFRDIPQTLVRAVRNRLANPQVANEITTRTAYAAVYTAQSLMLGGFITYMMTGKNPTKDITDMIYPRLPDGTRVTTMTFVREFGAIYYHWMNEGMVTGAENFILSKAGPTFQSFVDVLRNADYFGNQIIDKHADIFTQVEQGMKYFGAQAITPISFSSAVRNPQAGPGKAALGIGGLNTAPGFVGRSSLMGRILAEYKVLFEGKVPVKDQEKREDERNLRSVARTFERARTPENKAALDAEVKKFHEKYHDLPHIGKVIRGIEQHAEQPDGFGAFKQMGRFPSVQVDFFNEASPAEKAMLAQGLSREARKMLGLPKHLMPRPTQFKGYSPEDQENFLWAIKPGARDHYLSVADPQIRAKFQPFMGANQ